MTIYKRIDKNEARRAYDTNKVIVMSLNKPDMQIGETVEWELVTTVTKNGTGGQTFDKMAEEALEWKHRYPGSKGLVWYTPVPEPRVRTPYDTGKRAEPRPWTAPHRESEEDFGKVDFEDDAGGTIATLYIEQEDDRSYTLKGYTNEPLKVDIGQEDPEEPQVYWDMAHDGDDEHTPFGDDTARIIDLQRGGVIAYCHKDTADRLVGAIWSKEGA